MELVVAIRLQHQTFVTFGDGRLTVLAMQPVVACCMKQLLQAVNIYANREPERNAAPYTCSDTVSWPVSV